MPQNLWNARRGGRKFGSWNRRKEKEKTATGGIKKAGRANCRTDALTPAGYPASTLLTRIGSTSTGCFVFRF
jgi:hypothetical protein